MSDDKLPLHFKRKQLSAIRKATRLLRDPATTNLSSASPPYTQPLDSDHLNPPPLVSAAASSEDNSAPPKKAVFLYNWNTHQRRSIKSLKSNTPSSSSSSKTNTYSRRASLILRCRDTNTKNVLATPSMRRALAARKNSPSSFRNKRKAKRTATASDNCSESHFSVASPLLPSLRRHKSCSINSGNDGGSSYVYTTPALSAASYNPYAVTNPSNVQSWTGSLDDNDLDRESDEDEDDRVGLPARQGCGIPCYWSKRTPPKYRGVSATCYSPSFSDTLRRKGGSIICGGSTKYSRKHVQPSKRRGNSRRRYGSDSFDVKAASSIGTGRSDDELSMNFGEIDLEARSRLDGRRWSASCRSREGMEIIAVNGDSKGQGTPDSIVSLSNKYRPMFFSELIGQHIVVQSLTNAISSGRISPVYLFQGPRGTGKTSTTRIFAASLNCLATEELGPCGDCRQCTIYLSGESKYYVKVDATDTKTIEQIRQSWRTLAKESAFPTAPYRVFVIDECHLLSSKTWLALLKFLEDQPMRVVFIFITTDLDCVPRAIVSRCQKYIFNKLKEGDIVNRLSRIVAEENLDVEPDAFDLIALNADGSLRDAETMLDQLSLLGRKITASLVHELVGIVSDENLLEILELAMSSETAETVKKARELMDSGVDPVVLTSQLASLIMDIIAGTYQIVDAIPNDDVLGEGSLNESELGRLMLALKLLSEGEKQLRISSDQATWFTATLLQLGSTSSADPTLSTSSRRHGSKTTEGDPSTASRDAYSQKPVSSDRFLSHKSISSESFPKAAGDSPNNQRKVTLRLESPNSKAMLTKVLDGSISGASTDDTPLRQVTVAKVDANRLDSIYRRSTEKCHSNTLKQLLNTHGTLVSLYEEEGVLVACIAFRDVEFKSRAERFLSSIVNSFEMVLRCNVEIRMIISSNSTSSDHGKNPAHLQDKLFFQQTERHMDNKWKEKALGSGRVDDVCEKQKALLISQGSLNTSTRKFHDISDCSSTETTLGSADRKVKLNDSKERKQGAPMQRIESIIREQRLETAWLQAVEKSASGSMNCTKPEKNQVLPQEGMNPTSESLDPVNGLSQEQNLPGADKAGLPQTDQLSNHHLIVPSSLHDKSFTRTLRKDTTDYESGPGTGRCSGFFCWNTRSLHKQKQKVTQESPQDQHRDARFSCLGDCCRSKRR